LKLPSAKAAWSQYPPLKPANEVTWHSPGTASAEGVVGARKKQPATAGMALNSIRFRITNSGDSCGL